MSSTANQPNALRRALLLDAAASGAMGLMLATAASPLASLFGLPPSLLRYVGLFLVPFAGMLIWIATRRSVPLGVTRFIVIGNVGWVVASALLLVSGLVNPTVIGEAFVIAQALAVSLFVYLEYTGLRTAGESMASRAASA